MNLATANSRTNRQKIADRYAKKSIADRYAKNQPKKNLRKIDNAPAAALALNKGVYSRYIYSNYNNYSR